MVRLTRPLGALTRLLLGSRRRKLAVLVVPVLVVVALLAPRQLSGSRRDGMVAGGRGPAAAPSGTLRPTGLPGTSGPVPGPTAPARPAPRLGRAPAAAAADYIRTANAHDARPGRDRDFLDSYRRARPYLTPELFGLVTTPSRRGDYQWAEWLRQRATVSVAVVRVAVPDGAPVPTGRTAYARIQFRQRVTPTVPGAAAREEQSAVTLVVSQGRNGGWLVSRLLSDT